jgi:hypothetical protein
VAAVNESGDDRPGRWIVTSDAAGTVAFALACVVGVADPDPLGLVTAAVSIVLFVAGCVAFLAALAVAAQRSRRETVSLGGVYFLSGSAPRWPRRTLLSLLAVQVVVAVVAGVVRIYTPVAFAALAPMFGLGLTGLWGARHGTFPPR